MSTPRSRCRAFLASLAITVFCIAGTLPLRARPPDPAVLAQVYVTGDVQRLVLPVHALLQDPEGRDYALVLGTRGEVSAAGFEFRILDGSAATGTHYAVVHDPAGRWQELPAVRILLREGSRRVVATTDGGALTAQGLDFSWLDDPLRWPGTRNGEPGWSARTVPPAWRALTYDARLAALLDRVRQPDLVAFISDLTGETAVAAQGNVQRITSRHTAATVPLRSALDYAVDHFEGLGLSAVRHSWTSSGYSGTNVIATIAGSSLATQIVVLCAHLDAMPNVARSYGADDNASGCAAVLAAASALRHLTLDRTVRLCLFTGEEQGLLGSARYALKAVADGDDIVAVFNADMIGWDAAGGPVVNLFTRTILNPGQAGDRAIADVFTNVVATYLPGQLDPVIVASGLSASDHSSFWNRGYPAVLGIEDDDGGDFCAYYHTVNDRLPTLNLAFLTAYCRAIAGTVAQLAGLAGDAGFDAIEVGLADWQGATNGAGIFFARHDAAAAEGLDGLDVAWTNAPAGTNTIRYRAASVVNGTELKIDARPLASTSVCTGRFTVFGPTGTVFSASPQVRLLHHRTLDTQRVYHARIVLEAVHAGGAEWRCVTNLRDLARSGGVVAIPPLQNLTNGAAIGRFELAAGFLATNATAFPLALEKGTGGLPVLVQTVQPGAQVVDTLEVSTNLSDAGNWQAVAVATNAVAPDEFTFPAGFATVRQALDATNRAASAFRVRRSWTPIPPGD